MRLHPEINLLLKEITNYCAANKLTKTRFGIMVANDGHFVDRLRNGRMSYLPTIDRVRAYMRGKINNNGKPRSRSA